MESLICEKSREVKAKVIKMSQGKVVSQNIAIILGVLCAVFALVAVGAFIVPHGSTGGDDAAYAALQASNSAYVNDHSHTNADYENLKSQLQQAQSQLSGSSGDSSTISQLQSQIDSLNSQISQKNADISSLNSQISSLNDQISSLKSASLLGVNLKYEDNRPLLQDAYLRVYGNVVNTGSNTAYNAKIHVILYQGSVVAEDTTINLGTISGKSSTNVDSKIYYTGSAITTYSATFQFT